MPVLEARTATIGSTRDARRAGARLATSTTAMSIPPTIVRRAIFQLLMGVAAGVGPGLWLLAEIGDDPLTQGGHPAYTVAACAGFMLLVGMVACVVPTVRGLKIRPVKALGDPDTRKEVALTETVEDRFGRNGRTTGGDGGSRGGVSRNG